MIAVTAESKQIEELKKEGMAMQEHLQASREQNAATIYSMQNEYEATLREYANQRIHVVDDQRSSLLRRAILAEDEVKHLQEELENQSQGAGKEIADTVASKSAPELEQYLLNESNLQKQVVDLKNQLFKQQAKTELLVKDHESQLTFLQKLKQDEISNLNFIHKENETAALESHSVKQVEMSAQLSHLNKCLSNIKSDHSSAVAKLQAELHHCNLILEENEITIKAFVDTKYDVEMSVKNVLKENQKLQQQLASAEYRNTRNY